MSAPDIRCPRPSPRISRSSGRYLGWGGKGQKRQTKAQNQCRKSTATHLISTFVLQLSVKDLLSYPILPGEQAGLAPCRSSYTYPFHENKVKILKPDLSSQPSIEPGVSNHGNCKTCGLQFPEFPRILGDGSPHALQCPRLHMPALHPGVESQHPESKAEISHFTFISAFILQ